MNSGIYTIKVVLRTSQSLDSVLCTVDGENDGIVVLDDADNDAAHVVVQTTKQKAQNFTFWWILSLESMPVYDSKQGID
jgi:hypothetical protein